MQQSPQAFIPPQSLRTVSGAALAFNQATLKMREIHFSIGISKKKRQKKRLPTEPKGLNSVFHSALYGLSKLWQKIGIFLFLSLFLSLSFFFPLSFSFLSYFFFK